MEMYRRMSMSDITIFGEDYETDNFDKATSKEELMLLLRKFSWMLSKEINDYLMSLLELEFSVIKNYISDDEKTYLDLGGNFNGWEMYTNGLEVYRRFALYNIYHRALKIFEQDKTGLIISGNNGIESLDVSAKIGNREFKLFDFKMRKIFAIADISLYQAIAGKDIREAEMLRIMAKLNKLNSQENPYSASEDAKKASKWDIKHSKQIKTYTDMYNLLESKKVLTDEDKRRIEITQKFHELFLADYGLTAQDLGKENEEPPIIYKNATLGKVYVKRIPEITVKDNITYL